MKIEKSENDNNCICTCLNLQISTVNLVGANLEFLQPALIMFMTKKNKNWTQGGSLLQGVL